ncbi:MAG TPA: hypothetical protein VMV65_07460, partial [Alphaproteobacteria bacterium]|nr:hypothetical protein [Alphaproteobacteria bacterium]
MHRHRILATCLVLACGALGAAASRTIWLPTDWTLTPPSGDVSTTGTMPQGLALSPDDTKIAVVESGVNPPALRILDTRDLHTLRVVALKDAFGTPVWAGNDRVLVPGATTDAVETVNAADGDVQSTHAASYVSAVARASNGAIYAVSDLRNVFVRVGTPMTTVPTGSHPAAIAIASRSFYVANRGEASVTHIAGETTSQTIAVDLHPAALALSNDGSKLYVACSDADVIDVIDTSNDRVIARIDVGLPQGRGASPNALAVAPDGTL